MTTSISFSRDTSLKYAIGKWINSVQQHRIIPQTNGDNVDNSILWDIEWEMENITQKVYEAEYMDELFQNYSLIVV